MGKYFMQDKPLSNVERAMTQVPNGASNSGEFIGLCRLRYSARDPTCRSCLGGQTRNGAYRLCPYTHERLDIGALPYGELVERCFRRVKHTHFRNRVKDAVRRFPVFSFADSNHIHRLKEYLNHAGDPTGTRISPWNLASLYLITARETLWQRSEPALKEGSAVRTSVCAKGLSVQDYALYQMAKTLRRKEILVSPGELADRKLVSDETLRLIINAVLIAMYGQTIIREELKQP